MNKSIKLYNRYFQDNSFERVELFKLLNEKFKISKVLYLGSFLHITPSFIFSDVTYVDSDRRVEAFFADSEIYKFVEQHKAYKEQSKVVGLQQNYEKVDLPKKSYDLLISQYAGFVSRAGKKFLKTGGILLANNSHGDAGLAHLDKDFEFIGVCRHRGEKWNYSDKDLDEYFVPKKGEHPSQSEQISLGKGIGYKKTAPNYVFRKV